MNLSLLYGIIYTALDLENLRLATRSITHCFHSVEISGCYFSLVWFHDLLQHSLTHWSNLFGSYFRLLIWELMDATPTNNCSVLRRTTVTLSQNTLDCICLWAVPLPCCQRFNHLFVWILPFDLPGLVRPARCWSFHQYSS